MRLRQIAVALTVVGLAGCGTVRPAIAGHGGGKATVLSMAHRGGPPSATRAESLRLARRLTAGNVLPSGVRRLPQRPVPPGLRQVTLALGVTSSVDVYRLFALPISMKQAAAFLAKHAPAGMHGGGIGQAGDRNGITEMDVSYFPYRQPRGISSIALIDTVVPGPHGGSLLRTDVQVIWYPPRSAAEHLVAKDYRAVKVDAWLSAQGGRHVTRTFSSPVVIGRLTRLLNGLPASPGGIFPCPMEVATYRLTFEAASGPNVVVYTSGCASDSVSVGGAKQPALADWGKLTGLVGKIMHVHSPLASPRAAKPA